MKPLRSIVLIVSLSLVLAGFAIAQTAPPGAPPFALVSITTIVVRPGAVADFESYVKRVTAGAAKIGVRPANFYAMGRGGPNSTYMATVRYAKWAEMDARPSVPEILNKAYGEVEGTRINSAGRVTVESSSSVVLHVLPELSAAPSLENPFAHVRVSRIETKVGTTTKWEAYLGKVKEAQEKVGNALPVIRYSTALGPANVYMAAYFFNKYAELDGALTVPETLKKAYGGAEAAQLEETVQSCITNLEIYVLDYRADLSRPATAK